MTIKFTTTDGRTVETTDKDVLIAAARKREIGESTPIEIDGRVVLACKIKELPFGEPPVSVAPPVAPPRRLSKRAKAALRNLRGFVAFEHFIGALGVLALGGRIGEGGMIVVWIIGGLALLVGWLAQLSVLDLIHGALEDDDAR